MRPVPLREPGGRVIAYACGVCWRAPEHGVLYPRSYEKPDRQELAARRHEAARCCQCAVHDCKQQELPNGSECERHAAQREALRGAEPAVAVDFESWEAEQDEEREEELSEEIERVRARIAARQKEKTE